MFNFIPPENIYIFCFLGKQKSNSGLKWVTYKNWLTYDVLPLELKLSKNEYPIIHSDSDILYLTKLT